MGPSSSIKTEQCKSSSESKHAMKSSSYVVPAAAVADKQPLPPGLLPLLLLLINATVGSLPTII